MGTWCHHTARRILSTQTNTRDTHRNHFSRGREGAENSFPCSEGAATVVRTTDKHTSTWRKKRHGGAASRERRDVCCQTQSIQRALYSRNTALPLCVRVYCRYTQERKKREGRLEHLYRARSTSRNFVTRSQRQTLLFATRSAPQERSSRMCLWFRLFTRAFSHVVKKTLASKGPRTRPTRAAREVSMKSRDTFLNYDGRTPRGRRKA